MVDGEEPGAEASVARLLDVLLVGEADARTTEDVFSASSHPMPHGRIYGGQVLAQAVVAASRTAPADRPIHSLHAYFLRPGDPDQSITYSVDRLRDGGSFSARRTQAFQGGKPIFSSIASFQGVEEGREHAAPMPADFPPPEDVPPRPPRDPASPKALRAFRNPAVEVRPAGIVPVPGSTLPRQAVWMRVAAPLPEEPLVHAAMIAYLSDMSLQSAILRPHALSFADDKVLLASLDHALWWHRPARTDDWLLYVQESPNARGGRGLATGAMYTRSGDLVATVSQEAMFRVRPENG